MQKLIDEGGENASKAKDTWARRRFYFWRSETGLDTSVAIEKLDLGDFSKMLEKFILQIQKCDDTLYPSEALKALVNSFHRIIKREQENRVAVSGINELPFDIFSHLLFKKAIMNMELAMQRSGKCGAIHQREKSKLLTAEDEAKILCHPAHQITNAIGLQRRFGYFCMSRFLVRGGSELAKLRDSMFWIGEDRFGKYLAFCETVNKNHHVDRRHFKPEDFRPTVMCREADEIVTWEVLLFHLPIYMVDDDFGGRFIFLQAILSHISDVWYNTNHCSVNTLRKWLKQMAINAGLGDGYDNKSCRTSSITWLQSCDVPEEVGMQITGHKSLEAYKRYDQSGDERVAAAMLVLNSGGTLKYNDALMQVRNSAGTSLNGGSISRQVSSGAGCSHSTIFDGDKPENVVVEADDLRRSTMSSVLDNSFKGADDDVLTKLVSDVDALRARDLHVQKIKAVVEESIRSLDDAILDKMYNEFECWMQKEKLLKMKEDEGLNSRYSFVGNSNCTITVNMMFNDPSSPPIKKKAVMLEK